MVRYYPCDSPRRYDFDRARDRMVPVRCDSNACQGCRKRNVELRAGAIAEARPERYVVLTGVPAPYVKFSSLRRKLDRYLERAGYSLGEWVVTVEINPRGTGHHANVLTHSAPAIPRHVLSDAAACAGLGPHVSSEPVRSFKAVSHYVLSDASDDARADGYLAANAGRLTHQSRGFFGA